MQAHGEVVFIGEIPKEKHNSVDGKSVKLCGRLDEHNFEECRATLTDPQTCASVTLDTSLVEPFDSHIGALFQVIGELEYSEKYSSVVLRTRVIRSVDGLDLILYRNVIATQREYINSRTET
ncbi:CST complex subunit TEN1-like [Mizuhopecten yessoensis]|uniref:CST complex subunit TEN1-like n=1 Tax=Mizuhopecten yessoensis TaxID=6573 RepID=UPI000B4597E3|nr:CST complex subunit TEN1-like [Mizuhopecten yessoensis]